jgi:amidase
VSTFITPLDSTGAGPRVAVKDLIDVVGVPTTAGSKVVAAAAQPAEIDAACLSGLRAADARIVGKTNLHELAMLPLGTNPWFGTPVNPLDPALIPGGSSSGSAVAVATDEADVALGSDTGGSIRVPSASCGTAGLKTTHGRIPLDGVWPLAPSLDTVGPMARDVAGLVLGMELLEPGFAVTRPATTVGRIRTGGDPAIEAAVDEALAAAELDVVDIEVDLEQGGGAFATTYFNEVWELDHELVESGGVGDDLVGFLAMAPMFRAPDEDARRLCDEWKEALRAAFDRVELLALPTMPVLPPRLDALDAETLAGIVIEVTSLVAPFNAGGVPATAQPVPIAGNPIPASLQLVGPWGGEELLLPTALRIESAIG